MSLNLDPHVIMHSSIKASLLVLAVALFTAPAHAYIGPGGGLSALGALLALVAGLIIAFFGFFWYPIRRMRRRRREQAAAAKAPPGGRTPVA